MGIKDLNKFERPRERLKSFGPSYLSDLELVEIIIGSGTKGARVDAIAREILSLIKRGMDELNLENLLKIKGLSLAKASKLVAAKELFSRYRDGKVKITSPRDALPFLEDIRKKKQEHFVVLSLDGGKGVMSRRVVSVGTLERSIVHPREVFSEVVAERGASVILSHNHPSGDKTPSRNDLEVTKRLVEAGKILGIEVLDHIIVTEDDYFSFKEEGLL